jgi:hypothetical protein
MIIEPEPAQRQESIPKFRASKVIKNGTSRRKSRLRTKEEFSINGPLSLMK